MALSRQLSSAPQTMIRYLKNRLAHIREPLRGFALGRLEISVMEILWTQPDCCVRDVMERLGRPLAYTTVMTTLDRLFKKGLLDRRMLQRAFVYSSRFSRQEWEQKRAGELVAAFLAGPDPSRELLLSCFLDVVGQRDPVLLDELEKKIRTKRKDLSGRREP